MRFIADFHIHSHYSRATSKKLTPEYLEYWAKVKGINVVGTGDCTHLGWLKELKEKLEPAGNGLYKLKNSYQLDASKYLSQTIKNKVFFVLTGEISNIYKKNEKTRKVHNVCVLPDFEAADIFRNKLGKIGNLHSDGRPILGLDAKLLLEMLLESSSSSYLIPAHIWTPWFSVLGSKSGFDSIEECYEDLTSHIFAVETGLSSDPAMNRLCSFLDKFRLVSNSDAHSPDKLGREANLFDTEISYEAILSALRDDNGFLGTIEFFPQEGKYHHDGHRACNLVWNPLETIENKGICSVCGKPVTKGVMYRVAELSDRPEAESNYGKQNYFSITPLPELLAEIFGVKNTSSVKVQRYYFDLIKRIGPELEILLETDIKKIKELGSEILAEGVRRLRVGDVHITEGYDGEFGRIKAFNPVEIVGFAN